MNKVYFLPLALAAAFSAVADETYTNIVTGVDSVSDEGVPTAVGGTWVIPQSVEHAKDGNAVVFDTGDSEMQLNITAAPADTNTIVRIEVEATLADAVELSDVNTAQTGFAVCTNSYNAWDGTAWVALDEVPSGVDDTKVTNLTVEVSYQHPDFRKARFTVGDTVLRPRDSEDAWITLYNNTSNSIAGLGFSGAGTLARADASVMLGVAEYNGVKYGTLSDAVAAAASDPLPVINVVRDVEGEITVPGNVTVEVRPNKSEFTSTVGAVVGTSGTYTIPVNISGISGGTVELKLPDSMSNKEIVGTPDHTGSTISFTIQTATSVLAAAEPNGLAAPTNKIDELRNYLNTHANAAYIAADASAETIKAALEAKRENGLPLYQSYALGIAPTDSVKPVTVANDTATDGVSLSIPALKGKTPSGDYTITYKVGDTTVTATYKVDDKTVMADAVKIPLPARGTGSSTEVKISFE